MFHFRPDATSGGKKGEGRGVEWEVEEDMETQGCVCVGIRGVEHHHGHPVIEESLAKSH